MLIEDRARQLRRAIPSAITELSNATRHPSALSRQDVAKRHAEAINVAGEYKVLAASLLAAADAALARLIPPTPPSQPFDPMMSLFDPSRVPPRPGSPPLASALAATCAEPQE